MKLLILGLDGLEYKLVERWNLEVFKQKVYGKHDVSFFRNIFTPIVWSSFLLGDNAEKLGFTVESLRGRHVPQKVRPLWNLRRRFIKRSLGIRKLMVKLGLLNPYPPCNLPDHLKKRTFLEILKEKGYRVYAIEVPGYNEETNEKYRCIHKKYIFADSLHKKHFAYELLNDAFNRLLRAVFAVLENYDLVFAYLTVPDLWNHIYHPSFGMKSRIKLYSMHLKLQKMVNGVIQRATEEGFTTLIVSDHGIDLKELDHSGHGFWSLNEDYGFRPKTILDFKKFVLEVFP